MTVFVASLGRAGTSLLMQMLDAGGYPVVGTAPAYEVDNPQAYAGQNVAVKLLDPHHQRPPNGKYRWVWLGRDPHEQAKSSNKFLLTIGKPQIPHLQILDAIHRDRRLALSCIRRIGGPLLKLRWEQLNENPFRVAQQLQKFCGTALDLQAMCSCKIDRSNECLPYMLEIEQIRQRDLTNRSE